MCNYVAIKLNFTKLIENDIVDRYVFSDNNASLDYGGSCLSSGRPDGLNPTLQQQLKLSLQDIAG
ncbi:hypothetical protein RHGRI_023366 [Rhododendron griersonianum]|uniref:Uncharacterized protein n=1 Tax=Rhododendron griersonianum TaxID=479676 RepID=A0AAV6J3I3_9ERIC|nr:hypothetical protein RHGRI_023366 [Rhododendron griersonianum]